MNTMKAIETAYKGHRFRSRLEARWAVFFDHAGVDWIYEPEGFETPDGRYLPDFFLPNVRKGVWIEVKPKITADALAAAKLQHVVTHTGFDGMIIGELPSQADLKEGPQSFPGVNGWSAWAMLFGTGGQDSPYVFCVCRHTKKVGCEFDGRSARINPHLNPGDDRSYSHDAPVLLEAYDAARWARFEFGETP